MADLTPADLELLSAYLDDELAPDERADLERRLATEDVLWAELETFQQVTALVRDRLPVPRAPRDFRLDPAVYGRPARQPARQSSLRRFYRQWGAVVAVAATLAVVVCAGLSMMGPAVSNILGSIVTELSSVGGPVGDGAGVAVAPTATEVRLEGEDAGAVSSETERQVPTVPATTTATPTMTPPSTATPTPLPTTTPPVDQALAAAPETIASPESPDTSEPMGDPGTITDATSDDAMAEAVEESAGGTGGEALDGALPASTQVQAFPTPTAALAQDQGGFYVDEVSLTATTLTQELGEVALQPGAVDANALIMTSTAIVEGYFAATASVGTLAAPAVAQPTLLAAMPTATRIPMTSTPEPLPGAVAQNGEADEQDADHTLQTTATALANEAFASAATLVPSSTPLPSPVAVVASPEPPQETQQEVGQASPPPLGVFPPPDEQGGRDLAGEDGQPFFIDPGIFVGAVIVLLTLVTVYVALRRRRT